MCSYVTTTVYQYLSHYSILLTLLSYIEKSKGLFYILQYKCYSTD